jgi:hypothetical protein
MNARKVVLPGLMLIGGAVLGRMLSITTLTRGFMTALALTGIGAESRAATPRRRRRNVTHRPARKKPTQKKSARVHSGD